MNMTRERLILLSLSKKRTKKKFQTQGIPSTGDRACGVQCALGLQQNSVVLFFGGTLQLEVILSFEIQDKM